MRRDSANWPHLEPSYLLWHSTWRECSFRYDINQQFPLFAMRRVEREVLSAEKCEMLVLIDLWCKCSVLCLLARSLSKVRNLLWNYSSNKASLKCTLRASFSRRTCWNCLNFITKLITVTAKLFPNMFLFQNRHVLSPPCEWEFCCLIIIQSARFTIENWIIKIIFLKTRA